VILALLLRAIVAPIMLIATVVLSFAAALGVSALMFDHVFGFGGADTSFPLFVFVFLVALGIDYNIFLMTRVREEAKRDGPRTAAFLNQRVTAGRGGLPAEADAPRAWHTTRRQYASKALVNSAAWSAREGGRKPSASG